MKDLEPARKPGKKLTQLLDTAEQLFRQHGIRRVSVEELCRRAGISKATFYKHYANRNQLVIAVMSRIMDAIFIRYKQLVESDQPYQIQLQQLMELDRETSKSLGAPLIEDLMDPAQTELQEWLKGEEQKSRQMTLDFLIKGQTAGVLNPHYSPEFFLYLFDLSYGLFLDPRLKSICPDALTRGQWLYEFVMYGLMAPPEEAGA